MDFAFNEEQLAYKALPAVRRRQIRPVAAQHDAEE